MPDRNKELGFAKALSSAIVPPLKESAHSTTDWERWTVEAEADGSIRLRISVLLKPGQRKRRQVQKPREVRGEFSYTDLCALAAMVDHDDDPEVRRAACAVHEYATGASMRTAASNAERSLGWFRGVLEQVNTEGVGVLKSILYRPYRTKSQTQSKT
jgi:hypothetical protein